jgi:hypothetical protein
MEFVIRVHRSQPVAVDGYVSILPVPAIWWLTGRLPRRPDRP